MGGCNFNENTVNVNVIEESLNISIGEDIINVSVESWGGGSESTPSHMEVEITGDQLGTTDRIFIGAAFDGRKVQSTAVDVLDGGFDVSVEMTVGTEAAMAVLMAANENDIHTIGQYSIVNNWEYVGRPNLYAFFNPSIASIDGRCLVTIYFT